MFYYFSRSIVLVLFWLFLLGPMVEAEGKKGDVRMVSGEARGSSRTKACANAKSDARGQRIWTLGEDVVWIGSCDCDKEDTSRMEKWHCTVDMKFKQD